MFSSCHDCGCEYDFCLRMTFFRIKMIENHDGQLNFKIPGKMNTEIHLLNENDCLASSRLYCTSLMWSLQLHFSKPFWLGKRALMLVLPGFNVFDILVRLWCDLRMCREKKMPRVSSSRSSYSRIPMSSRKTINGVVKREATYWHQWPNTCGKFEIRLNC